MSKENPERYDIFKAHSNYTILIEKIESTSKPAWKVIKFYEDREFKKGLEHEIITAPQRCMFDEWFKNYGKYMRKASDKEIKYIDKLLNPPKPRKKKPPRPMNILDNIL